MDGTGMENHKRAFMRTLFGALGIGTIAASSRARAEVDGNWSPSMELQDKWLDDTHARHRQVFDTISTEGVARALTFTHTFYAANKDAYGIEPKGLAVVMILRAGSTGFGFNDKIWSKYSTGLTRRYKVSDPITKSAPVINIYNAADRAALLPTNGLTLEALAEMGGKFAICSVASRKLADALAAETGGNTESIYAELLANTIANARMAPAGIVTVNRAQEHHYALCYAG
jgi:hypothetical protein